MQTQTTKYKIVFLPTVEFDIIHDLIPEDNRSAYDALTIKNIKNFQLRDSLVVFVSEDSAELLRMKAKKGEQI